MNYYYRKKMSAKKIASEYEKKMLHLEKQIKKTRFKNLYKSKEILFYVFPKEIFILSVILKQMSKNIDIDEDFRDYFVELEKNIVRSGIVYIKINAFKLLFSFLKALKGNFSISIRMEYLEYRFKIRSMLKRHFIFSNFKLLIDFFLLLRNVYQIRKIKSIIDRMEFFV